MHALSTKLIDTIGARFAGAPTVADVGISEDRDL